MLKRRLLIALTLSSPAFAKELVDRVLAVVGDEPILLSDVRKFKESVSKGSALASIYRINPSTLTEEKILDRMIEEKIVAFSAKELDADAADSEVDSQISAIAKQNGMSIDQLKTSLTRENVPFETYKSNIRLQIQRRNIFDRELRRGGGVTESEVRAVYDAKAGSEIDLALVPKTGVKDLATLKKVVDAKATGADLESKYHAELLGWVAPDSLDDSIAKALKNAGSNSVVGPANVNGKPHYVVILGHRKGSEDDFQKTKGELMQEAQMKDYDKRFAAWLERRKTEMHIIRNTSEPTKVN